MQAIGSSAYTPATAALLMSAFPPERLAAAIGVWSVTGGITAAAGPPIAGALIKLGDWRWTFWFNVPFGLLVLLLLGYRHLVETERDRTRAIPDPLGALLVTVAVSPIVYALVQSTQMGLARCPYPRLRSLAGIAIMALFVLRCARHPNPLVDLAPVPISFAAHRQSRHVRDGDHLVLHHTGALVTFASTTWGWSALHIGGSTAPVSLMAGIVGIVAGRIAVRTGHRVFILPGAVAFALTMIGLWYVIDSSPSDLEMIVGSALIGSASGCVFPSFIAASMVEVPIAQHAVGSGVNFMSQRIGTTVGVALGDHLSHQPRRTRRPAPVLHRHDRRHDARIPDWIRINTRPGSPRRAARALIEFRADPAGGWRRIQPNQRQGAKAWTD